MHMRQRFFLKVFSLSFVGLVVGLVACAQLNGVASQQTSTPVASSSASTSVALSPSPASSGAAGRDLTPLFSKIWRVSEAPSQPPAGSINIFLANGTLLQTSCVETYLIAGWTIDKENPQVLQVSENGQPTYTAEMLELTDTTLRLRLSLIPSNETQDLTFTAVEEEFACPDLPK